MSISKSTEKIIDLIRESLDFFWDGELPKNNIRVLVAENPEVDALDVIMTYVRAGNRIRLDKILTDPSHPDHRRLLEIEKTFATGITN